MHDEIEKRDQLIYELINDRFRLEWQRTNDLDGKASNIVGFVGIIITLQAGLGIFLLKEIPKTFEFYFIFSVLFLSSIIFLICSILCGLKACYIKKWGVVPDPEHLIEKYAKEDRNRIDILRIVSQEISDTVKKNETANEDKATFIRYGFMFLVLGIAMVIMFMCGILLI